MNERVQIQMARQHGLVLRHQVLRAGLTVQDVQALLKARTWVAVRRGVYTSAARWDALDEHRGQPLLEAHAASLNMSYSHVASHDSAGLLHQMSLLRTSPRLTHVTRFGVLGGRTRHGVKHHKAPFSPDQLIEVDGWWALDRPRTVADIAREHGLGHGLVAADSALRLGDSRADLDSAIEPMASWPGVTIARRAVELADDGAESPGETLTRLMLLELGLGPVQTQFGLHHEGRAVWCDLRVGRHVVEFDGRVKYRPEHDGGFARESPEQVVWREKQRQDWVCGFKLGMSRVVWADLLPAAWETSKRRVLRECLDTAARFGTSIDDLAPYVVHGGR